LWGEQFAQNLGTAAGAFQQRWVFGNQRGKLRARAAHNILDQPPLNAFLHWYGG
jgi:hypothetical protein